MSDQNPLPAAPVAPAKYDIRSILKARAVDIAPKGPMPKPTVKSVNFQSHTTQGGGVSGAFMLIAVAGMFLTFQVKIDAEKNVCPVVELPSVRGIAQDSSNAKVLGWVRVGDHKDPNHGFALKGVPLAGMDRSGNLRFLKSVETLLAPISEGIKAGHEKEIREAGLLIDVKKDDGTVMTLVNLDMGEYNIPLTYYIADRDGALQCDALSAEWSVSTSPGQVTLENGRGQMFRGVIPGQDRSRDFMKKFFAEIVKTNEKAIQALPRRASVEGRDSNVLRANGRWKPEFAGARSDTQKAASAAVAGVKQGTDGVDFDEI